MAVGHQAIAFKILSNSGSDCISVGMGLTDVIKSHQYRMNGKNISNLDSDVNHGAYMISSMGVNFQHKEPEKQETQQSFVFSQNDIVEV